MRRYSTREFDALTAVAAAKVPTRKLERLRKRRARPALIKVYDQHSMNVPCLHTLLAGGGAHMLAAWVHSFGKNVGSTYGMPTWHTKLFLVIDEPLQLQKHPAQTSHNFQPDPLARRSQLQRSKLQPSQLQCNQWQCSQAVGKSVSDPSIAVQPSAAQLQCSRGTVSGTSRPSAVNGSAVSQRTVKHRVANYKVVIHSAVSCSTVAEQYNSLQSVAVQCVVVQ